MTEFLVSRTNPTTGIATDKNWHNDTYSSQQRVPGVNQGPTPQGSAPVSAVPATALPGSVGASSGSASAAIVSALKTTPTKEINLQEALEWLLGSPQPQDAHLSEDELESRKARRTELLMWLLNLELRLSPYGDPA